MELLLETFKRQNHTFIKIAGDFTFEGSLRLQKAFDDALLLSEIHFILDLKNCKLISSFAFSMILKLNDTVKEKNGTFKIISPSGDIAEVFDILGIRDVIPMYSSEEELLQNSTPHSA
jgi:anti-anti-sigma factor